MNLVINHFLWPFGTTGEEEEAEEEEGMAAVPRQAPLTVPRFP